ncbi:MAG: LLM class flavin-dependent oxidoreductase [Dehalococcoidia bacterium]|nr:LLM class flavin-dependent oxidoreductase [Dehalococcoidia bacterium]
MTDKPFEIGVSSFADTYPNPETGERISDEQRLANLLEEIELADKVGLDVFGVGEHHRPDFAASSPATILAAAAATTKNIRLTSAVTVLSTDDPVRVFQQFATVDLISHGRAELTAGRGSFTESYPLFGYDLDDYDELFEEKLDLLLTVRENERVTWAGNHRAGINNRGVYPRPAQEQLPVWIGVGGNPASVERAGRLGLPLIVAIIGGAPARFVPLVDYYRQSAAAAGRDPRSLPVAINSHTFIADDSRDAADDAQPVRSAPLAAGRAPRRLPGRSSGENPLRVRTVRARPVRRPDRRGATAARRRDARHRTPGHEGGPARP